MNWALTCLLVLSFQAWAMSDAEFDAFLDRAVAELKEKQNVLDAQYGIGSGRGRWAYDQDSALLQFFDENDRLTAEADTVTIGSYAPRSGTWKWAWSNDSLLPEIRRKAEKVKELTTVTGLRLFSRPEAFKIEGEPMAWELAAMSVQHLGALGAYRAPTDGGPTVFLAITAIRRR